MAKVNIIICGTWVPKGAAKSDPDKVELSKEELAALMKESKNEINIDTDTQSADMDSIDGEDALTKYNLNSYDKESDSVWKFNDLLVHYDENDDPYITLKEDNEEVVSENENMKILPTDNMLAVGHVDGDAATLEVYVYNEREKSFYVHHDCFLTDVPLCMEWLNFDPNEESLKPGNLVAVGYISPIIEVWDLDVVGCLEPSYKLGKKAKKKKNIPSYGHTDAVLDISWNQMADHLLSSGSVDQTVLVWDLQNQKIALTLDSFDGKVQTLSWHHLEAQCLLTGGTDSIIRIFDCNSDNTFKSWTLSGEVECAVWDKNTSQPYGCLAGLNNGAVMYIDARQEKPLWTIDAYSSSCTGIALSSSCPGCLVTVSEDKELKIWDIADGSPKFVAQKDVKIGVMSFVAPNPDCPFAFCMGGDKKDDNCRVLDVLTVKGVAPVFRSRVNLPIELEDEDIESEEEDFKEKQKTGKHHNRPKKIKGGRKKKKFRK